MSPSQTSKIKPTGVPMAALKAVGAAITTVPDSVKLHPSLTRIHEGQGGDGVHLRGLRLVHSRGARLWLAAARGQPRAPLWPGRRARHLQPPPCRAARPGDERDLRAAGARCAAVAVPPKDTAGVTLGDGKGAVLVIGARPAPARGSRVADKARAVPRPGGYPRRFGVGQPRARVPRWYCRVRPSRRVAGSCRAPAWPKQRPASLVSCTGTSLRAGPVPARPALEHLSGSFSAAPSARGPPDGPRRAPRRRRCGCMAALARRVVAHL